MNYFVSKLDMDRTRYLDKSVLQVKVRWSTHV